MELPKRKKLRLAGYDYSKNGANFITICTEKRRCLFGELCRGGFHIRPASASARMVGELWMETLRDYPGAASPQFVVMPNHFHGILTVERADMESAPTITEIIQTFKRRTTIQYISLVKQGLAPPFDKRVWQRSYYDHIIRDEQDYLRIWQYIAENPSKWREDRYFEE